MLTPDQLRAARALVDWTREDLAERSGVSPNTVSCCSLPLLIAGPERYSPLVPQRRLPGAWRHPRTSGWGCRQGKDTGTTASTSCTQISTASESLADGSAAPHWCLHCE